MNRQTRIALGAAAGSGTWGGLCAVVFPHLLCFPESYSEPLLVGIWSAAGGVFGVAAVLIAEKEEGE